MSYGQAALTTINNQQSKINNQNMSYGQAALTKIKNQNYPSSDRGQSVLSPGS